MRMVAVVDDAEVEFGHEHTAREVGGGRDGAEAGELHEGPQLLHIDHATKYVLYRWVFVKRFIGPILRPSAS